MFDVMPTVNPGTDKTAMPEDGPEDSPRRIAAHPEASQWVHQVRKKLILWKPGVYSWVTDQVPQGQLWNASHDRD
jgi:hypothetical protein